MESLRHHNHYADNSFSIELPPSHEQVKHAKRKALARPSILRSIIRIFTLVVGASILGVLVHAAAIWYMTRNDVLAQENGFRMRSWPYHMDLKPTWVMLAAAGVAIIVQIVATLTFVGPIRRLRESHLHTWTVFFTSLSGIALWIAATAYFKSQDLKGSRDWTLWSWSCSHENLTNGKMAFKTMCIKLNYSFYAAIAVAVLEIVSLALFGHKLRRIKQEGGGYTKITVQHI